MSNLDRHSFQRVLGRTDVLALAFGTMIGWGWIAMIASWIKSGGVLGSIFAFLIGAVLCILVGMVYSELAAALPLAGGEMVFTYRALGYHFSLFVSWTITFAYVGVAAWEGIALATAVDYILPIPNFGYLWDIAGHSVYFSWALVGIVGALIVSGLNYFGARPAAIFQVMITCAMVLIGFIFFFGGIAFGDISYVAPLFTNGSGIVAVLLIVPSMFIGFDIIPQSSEEMNIPPKQIGNILMFSIIMSVSWYIMMIIGISFAAPAEIRNAGLVPPADAIAYALQSPVFGKILIVGGIFGILSSWNGFIVGATRIIFAMGRAKMLPPIFGRLHPKYKTPTAAIILVGSICSISPLLGKNAIVWLVNVSSFQTVISYLMVCIAFWVLRRKEPSMLRPFEVKHGTLVSVCAILILTVLLFLYTPLGLNSLNWPYEWIMIILWLIIGIGMVAYTQNRYPNISVKDRELLIFGEEYRRDV